MSIPSLYGVSAQNPSSLAIVPSGQAQAAETVEQLTELNRSLKTDITVYKGVAATGFALAGLAGVYILWMRSLAQAQSAPSQPTFQYSAPPPPSYGYAPYGYR